MADDERTRVAPIDPLVGAVLDRRYKISMRIATGGFASIYQATQIATRREIALKVLNPKVSADPAVVARFRREAAALGQLRDPRTIKAYDFGEAADGTLYIAMELLRGESLYERYRARGPLPWRQMVSIAREVCHSLAEAHDHGIVHRDLKPTNIHIEPGEHVKVLDFGIAKIIRGTALDSADLTRAGQMIGTFDYMAPEQVVGGECTERSDIWTLGIVMYEMIAGQPPYGELDSPSAMMAAMVGKPPPHLSSLSDAPRALDAVISRCLAPKSRDRYANVQELALDLERTLLVTDAMQLEVTDRMQAAPMHDDATWIDDIPAPPPTPATMPGVEPKKKR